MARRSGDRPRRQPLAGWRRWLFPAAAATLAPALFLGLVELGLRAAGSGHPAGFFVPVPGQAAEMTNPRFGWRFFPKAIARSPVPGRLPRPRPSGSYRIFVLGGSAAMGTPEPAFAFGRVLEVLLEERYPDTRFEVVNAAMAAINSHVVLEIARDCARRRPDLFAVYLGNNEVVGPYGPGTVFTPAGASTRAIRLGLRLRRLRLGQLMARGLATGRRSPAPPAQWRGMEMFLNRLVAASDPRLERTYRQFEDNLMAVARLAEQAGAPLLLSTVAVDLRDTPPFASLHRADLTGAERERWQATVARSVELAAEGRLEPALGALRVALAIDDQHAESHFRAGHLELVAGALESARQHLARARDLDALRFRADSRINDAIRHVATTAPGTVRLVDGERKLAEAPESRSRLPGSELFWEHVHLRFPGNYRLAEAFLEQLEPLLPAKIRDGAAPGPPAPPERVAERLALTARERWQMAASIHQMTRRPPFTGQLGHEPRRQASKREVLRLRARAQAARDADLAAYRRALAQRQEDLPLLELYARALDGQGTPDEAVAVWRELVSRLPVVAPWRNRLGYALAEAGDVGAAAAELRRALELRPESAEPRVNLATVLERAGDRRDAERLYRQATAIDPADAAARANLADLLDREGRRDEAERQLRLLIELDPGSATAHRRLGELQDRHGEAAAAEASYRRALELDDELAPVHNNLGYLLAEAGRFDEAARQYLAAIDDDPGGALAYFNLGDLLLSLGRAAEATEAYRAGLALEPSNEQARANLQQAGRLAAAR
jgi:tetratricopeptide (TPR) repeat protein